MTDLLLFAVFPYLALVLAVAMGVHRYVADRFSFSSLSSQFLENRALFWGSVPWHYGIVAILVAHLLAALFPGSWGSLLGAPGRLYFLEVTGMSLGLFTLVGLLLLIARRAGNARIRSVTTVMDGILLADLALQVATGLYIAYSYRWGSLWYLHTAVPWLASLARLQPETAGIAPLPPVVRFHLFNAFIVVGLFPFTRLVHVFTVPIEYLWRPWQVVLWNRRPAP